ncbi:MAG TPA: PAS domain-containing protein [Edaphobacter sp.]
MSESPANIEYAIQRQSHGRRTEDERNEQLARLLTLMPDCVLCCDREWRITFANNEANRYLHLTPADFNSRTHWELFPDKAGTAIERAYRESMQTGKPVHLEYYCPTSDVWLDIHVLPTDEGIAIFFRDITDRKGAELLRDAASGQLRQVLEATTDAVVSLDRKGNFTYLNRRARGLLSIKGELIGKSVWEEFPAISEQGRYYLHRALNEGLPTDFEDFYPDPLDLWLSIQVRPAEDGIVIFFRDITARHKAQEELRRQHDLLYKVQETALVATWDVDLATGRIFVGEGSYPVFGYPHDQIQDIQSFTKFLLPEHVPILDQLIQRATETGELIVADFPIRTMDGSIRWVENRGQVVQVNGTPRLRGLSIDITQHKRNQEALAASEARYRILADLNPQAIWMAAPDGTMTYANQVLMDYLGFTNDDLLAERWIRAFHPDDRERVLATWTHCVATGTYYDLEARLIRARDGLPRWWWIRAQPVRDEHGNILHWLGVNIDIDDRKTFAEMLQQKQEETERQRAELESIYQSAPVGFALFDPVELRYLRVNDVQVQTIGLPREQILGRRITDLIPLEGLEAVLRRCAAGETIRNHVFEGELPARPGEYRYWNCNYSPVRNAEGKVEAIAAIIQEITHQKKSEAALIQSEKLAAVGRLASSISHEINNPLESIMNLLYLIGNSDELPAGLREYVEIAESELTRVCQIATQTLRFHRQAVNATWITASDLVDAVLNLYQGRLTNSRITIETRYSTSRPILCFENDIRQVLHNLMANAIDAMRQGGRLLVRAHDTIDRTPGGRGREGIRITIADTGHGMTPEVRARIFEPFYTTKDIKGTGLGLWISIGIVKRHQGRLTVRSSARPECHGAVFSLFLPRREEPPSL